MFGSSIVPFYLAWLYTSFNLLYLFSPIWPEWVELSLWELFKANSIQLYVKKYWSFRRIFDGTVMYSAIMTYVCIWCYWCFCKTHLVIWFIWYWKLENMCKLYSSTMAQSNYRLTKIQSFSLGDFHSSELFLCFSNLNFFLLLYPSTSYDCALVLFLTDL